MNPIEQITNEYITEIKFNMEVILDAVDLGPQPQIIRAPSHNEYDEMPLITDGTFLDTPNNFVMPEPCENCYIFSCNGHCCQETELIPRQLSFEEEFDLPPPPALRRINTTAPLLDEQWKDMNLRPQSLTRIHTNDHLPADDSEDESDEFDMPEGIQYVSISINKDTELRQHSLTRIHTNDHLPADEPENKLLAALSEAESNARDEYEETFFKGLEDKKQNQDK